MESLNGHSIEFMSVASINCCEQMPGQHGSKEQSRHFWGISTDNRLFILAVSHSINPSEFKMPSAGAFVKSLAVHLKTSPL